jgi:flavin-dependent dehydrogenase
MNIHEASRPFMDRVVLIGDCGVTRLYKDGIGAAFRTAKAAARTAVFSGVSADDFRRHYWPLYRSIARDNRYGFLLFAVMHRIKALEALLKGVLRTTAAEQTGGNGARRMSLVLWDMFTGSAPYRDIFFRTLAPGFLVEFLAGTVQAAVGGPREGVVS